MGTQFSEVYNRFLGKITDDMYVELTPQDTVRDLRNILISAIPGYEFCRKALDYTVDYKIIKEDEVTENDFLIGVVWDDDMEDNIDGEPPLVTIECSYFTADLTSEEINILAILMMCEWLQRQVTSIENIRMKYSGSDFKLTSQANHLQKLLSLLSECQRQSHHMQRLYKRRRPLEDGRYRSNWDVFGPNYGD